MTDEVANAHEQIIAGLEDVLRSVRGRDVPDLVTQGAKAGGYWNYRLFRHSHLDGEDFYQIHEAYYADGKLERWTDEGVAASGETARGVLECLARMAVALTKPTLDYKTGEEVEAPYRGERLA